MKVALVSPYDLGAAGGVQQVIFELARNLESEGADVRVLGPGVAEDRAVIPVGRLLTVRANRSAVPLTIDPRAGAVIRRAARDRDVVHVHEPFVPLAGWGGLRTGRPTVATFHADPPPWVRNGYRAFSRLGRRALRGATLTTVSPVAASSLPAAWGAVTVVPNGLTVAAYERPVPRAMQQVAFLGRDDPRKGLDVLLAAWPSVRRASPAARLVVVGARRVSALDGVVFRGRVTDDDKRDVLASSGILVAPNLGGESFGIVVAEGMAAGCAVVASDIAAFRHVLGSDGVLVAPGDAEVLATAIVGLLDDTGRARALGRAAQSAVGRFDWSEVTAGYRAAYESAVGGHRSSM